MLKLIRILIFIGSLLLIVLQWKNNTVFMDKILIIGYIYCGGSFCLVLTILFEMFYEKQQKNKSN